ncbi:hypothetical protein EDD17DRAFT_1548327, partial [Pisolithus thermaeus]
MPLTWCSMKRSTSTLVLTSLTALFRTTSPSFRPSCNPRMEPWIPHTILSAQCMHCSRRSPLWLLCLTPHGRV